MVTQQGDVLWVTFSARHGSAPAGFRPAVVIQHDRFNQSRIETLVVLAITSNLRYAALPGNVRLSKGEAGLPKPSVVNVTQIATVDRKSLGPKLGRLSNARIREIWGGVCLVLQPSDEALALS